MRAATLLFYAFVTLCLGLVTVAAGGVRALAMVIGWHDVETADQYGVLLSLGFAFWWLLAGIFRAISELEGPRPTEHD